MMTTDTLELLYKELGSELKKDPELQKMFSKIRIHSVLSKLMKEAKADADAKSVDVAFVAELTLLKFALDNEDFLMHVQAASIKHKDLLPDFQKQEADNKD